MGPRAPADLSIESKKFWRKMTLEYGIDDSGGMKILQTVCHAMTVERKAMDIIEAEGMTVLDRFDQTKSHPMLTVARDARSQIIQGLKALNLDIEPLKSIVGRPAGS